MTPKIQRILIPVDMHGRVLSQRLIIAHNVHAVAIRRSAQIIVNGKRGEVPTMNKTELTHRVAATRNVPNAAASRAVDAVIVAIKDALCQGENVNLTGFGSFTLRKRSARQGRNPRTGASITIPAREIPTFRASGLLNDAVESNGTRKT